MSVVASRIYSRSRETKIIVNKIKTIFLKPTFDQTYNGVFNVITSIFYKYTCEFLDVVNRFVIS